MAKVRVMTWNPRAIGGREDSFAEGWSAIQVDFNQVDGDYAELQVQAGYISGYIEKTGISVDVSVYRYLVLGLWGDGDYYVELYDGSTWLTAISESAPSTYGFRVVDLSSITSAVITGIRLGVGGGEGKKITYDFYEFLSEQPGQPQNLINLRVHQRENEPDVFEAEWFDEQLEEGHCIRIVVDSVKLFAGYIEEVGHKPGGVVEASGRCFQARLHTATLSIAFDQTELSEAVKRVVEDFPEISTSRVKPPSDPDCVGLWHLDEGEGSVAGDSSGCGHDGSINGATWVEGRYGKALSFDGVDDLVDCGHSPELMPEHEITVIAWVKPASVGGGEHSFVDKDYYNLIRSGDDVRWELNLTRADGTTYWSQVWAYDVLEADRWFFIAATYHRDGRQRLYINGELRAEATDRVSDHITSTTAPLYIGHRRGYWDGVIDEVVILNRELSPEEIWEAYSKGPVPVNISKTYIESHINDILDQLASIASKTTGKAWSWGLGHGQDLWFRPRDEGPLCSTSIQEGVNLLAGVRRGRDLYELANRIIILSGQVQYPWEDLYCEDISLWTIEWCGQCTDPKLKNDDVAKEGDYAMMIYDDSLNWWRVGRRIPSIDLTGYKGVRLWVKINGSWSGDGSDEVIIKFGSDNSNCYYKAVNLGVGINEWAHIDVELKRFAKKGNPDLSDVTWIALEAVWPSNLYGNVTWDGWHWYAENLKVEVRDVASGLPEHTYVYKDARLNRLELLRDLAKGLLEAMKAAADRILLPVIGAPDLQCGRRVQVDVPSLGLGGVYVIAESEHILNRREGYITRVLLESGRYALPSELRRLLERELRLERRGDLEVVIV